MMRLRHHMCFVWRLLYQAFEIRHEWSSINSFHSLDLTILLNLAFAYSENLGSHLLLVSKNDSMFLCFKAGQTKKSSTKTTHMSLHWDVEMMFPTPHERGAIALSPSQMYRWLLRVFTEDSVQHFKVKHDRFRLSLLLSIFPKTQILGESNMWTHNLGKKCIRNILQTYLKLHVTNRPIGLFLFGCFFHFPTKLVSAICWGHMAIAWDPGGNWHHSGRWLENIHTVTYTFEQIQGIDIRYPK